MLWLNIQQLLVGRNDELLICFICCLHFYNFMHMHQKATEYCQYEKLEADFCAALQRIGFTPEEHGAIIDYSGCWNLAVLDLLSEEDLIRMCKSFCSRPNLPIPSLTVLQEKLLLGIRFWISNRQSLQLPFVANKFRIHTSYPMLTDTR